MDPFDNVKNENITAENLSPSWQKLANQLLDEGIGSHIVITLLEKYSRLSFEKLARAIDHTELYTTINDHLSKNEQELLSKAQARLILKVIKTIQAAKQPRPLNKFKTPDTDAAMNAIAIKFDKLEILLNEPIDKSDLVKLKNQEVETLSDWLKQKDDFELTEKTQRLLDDFLRLSPIVNELDEIKLLRKAKLTYSIDIANIQAKSVDETAKKIGIKKSQLKSIIQNAQEHIARTASFLDQVVIEETPNINIVGGTLIGVDKLCFPCANENTPFSKFAYYVYLVQQTGLTLDEIKDELQVDLDLKKLSPENDNVFIEDPLASCNKISELCWVIRKLQDYLAQKQNQADSLSLRMKYKYLDYEAWKADRIAYHYTELRAFWQNDILTSTERTDENSGSIVSRLGSSKSLIREQLQQCSVALDAAKSDVSNTTVDAARFLILDNFNEEPFYNDFLRGLEIIEKILLIDDIIENVSVYVKEDEPGLAIADLDLAFDKINNLASEIFPADSSWNSNTGNLSYEDIAELPFLLRKNYLNESYEDLIAGRKLLFEPINRNVVLQGLSDNGEIDIHDTSAWSSHSDFENLDDGSVYLSKTSTQSTTKRHLRYLDGDELEDYIVAFDFTPQANSVGELQLDVRRDEHGRGYRLSIKTEIESNDSSTPVDPFLEFLFGVDDEISNEVDFLVLERIDIDDAIDELARAKIGSHARIAETLDDIKGRAITIDHTYRLSLKVSGPEIIGKLVITPDRILEVKKDLDTNYDKGSFCISGDASFHAIISNFEFKHESGGLPPFYRPGISSGSQVLPKMQLDELPYLAHVAYGHGMSLDLMPYDLVQTSNGFTRKRLHGVTRNDKNLYMVFADGALSVSPSSMDATLRRCLALLFFIKFAVIPTRYSQAHFALGNYEKALNYLHLLYDDRAQTNNQDDKIIYSLFTTSSSLTHRITSADEKLLRLRIAEVCLAWGEQLFRQDDDFSKHKARRLFERVLKLHEHKNCNCESRLGTISEEIIDKWIAIVTTSGSIDIVNQANKLGLLEYIYENKDRLPANEDIIGLVDREMTSDTADGFINESDSLRKKLENVVSKYESEVKNKITYNGTIDRGYELVRNAESHVVANLNSKIGNLQSNTNYHWIYGAFNYPDFCLPINPLKSQQIKQTCLMLDLINSCRNILGYHDSFVPTLRFGSLIQIAQNFTDRASSTERDYFTFKRMFEDESYALMQAEDKLRIEQANVNLERQNVSLAAGEAKQAELQLYQANHARNYYQQLIDEGLSDSENAALTAAGISVGFQAVALAGGIASSAIGIAASGGGLAAARAVAGGVSGVAGSLSSMSSSISNLYSMQASYERREQEWTYSRDQANYNVSLAANNNQLAGLRFDIAKRRLQISELNKDNVSNGLRFLKNKFLNLEMLSWMVKTTKEQYRTRLNYAIASGYMAERSLAFQQLNDSINVIRFDYFSEKRDGILGATQLQTDLESLKSIKLSNESRRLQLSKTISLAELAPQEFAEFTQTGTLAFSTLNNWFDRDFPGHYMRQIKSVKVSLLALVPPIQGIHATLTNSGISRVVLGPPLKNAFEQQVVSRAPETIALTSPYQSTGLFVLDHNDSLLLPFEGLGVETDWYFELPRPSNRFDYNSIFDLLFTIEYTAEESEEYRSQIISALGDTELFDKSYSLKNNFPDQWYHLNNVDDSESKRIATLTIDENDFPHGITDLKIKHLVMLVKTNTNSVFNVEVTLKSNLSSGTISAKETPVENIISTRSATTSQWSAFINKGIIGEWYLEFDNSDTIKQLFDNHYIEDIMIIYSCESKLVSWPRTN